MLYCSASFSKIAAILLTLPTNLSKLPSMFCWCLACCAINSPLAVFFFQEGEEEGEEEEEEEEKEEEEEEEGRSSSKSFPTS